jgi:outer membrane lipoprotein-sorting protein
LDAIFWPPLPAGQQVLFEEAEAAPERYYVLTLLRQTDGGLEVARKVWFDRADLRISRVQLFGPGGRYDSDIAYSDWEAVAAGGTNAAAAAPRDTSAGPLFPRQIHIRRPQQDYALTVSITRLSVNMEIADDRFTLEQPAGTELVRLETPAEERP